MKIDCITNISKWLNARTDDLTYLIFSINIIFLIVTGVFVLISKMKFMCISSALCWVIGYRPTSFTIIKCCGLHTHIPQL